MKDRKRIKKTSLQQESRMAKLVGGRTEANSGAAKFAGADVRKQGELRIECKFTESGSYRLKLSDLEKLRLQAIDGGLESPVFQIDFRNKKTGRSKSYVVIPLTDYMFLRSNLSVKD